VSRARGSALALAVAGLVVLADQLSKALVRGSIERGEARPLLPGVDLVHVRNPGIAFGLFPGGGTLLILLAAVAMLVLASVFFLHAGTPLAWLPSGLLLGGALGNLVDRLRDGAVTDFIDLPRWPAFNFADTAITIGVVALVYVLEGPPRRRRVAGA
jgi:signal peptidase II